MTDLRLWHGGVPGLRVGDLLAPGYERRHHEGCPWCDARAKGEAFLGLDPPGHRPDKVYLTIEREYARFYASLYGYGDLYRVEPVGELEPSLEDNIPSYTAKGARVLAVYDRAVRLTGSQRRALNRLWAYYDAASGGRS